MTTKPFNLNLDEKLKADLKEHGENQTPKKSISNLLHEGGMKVLADAINSTPLPDTKTLGDMFDDMARMVTEMKSDIDTICKDFKK